MGETCSTSGHIESCIENINRNNLLGDLSLETYINRRCYIQFTDKMKGNISTYVRNQVILSMENCKTLSVARILYRRIAG